MLICHIIPERMILFPLEAVGSEMSGARLTYPIQVVSPVWDMWYIHPGM